MGQNNAFFQLIVNPEGTFLKVFPATIAGTPLDINEVVDYLNIHNCTAYDIRDLNRALQSAEETELLVGQMYPLYVNEEMKIRVSADKMLVTCRFYPASEKGNPITTLEILRDLNQQGISVGIRQEEILRFMNHKEYCTNYVFVAGKPARNGKDAKIEYYFNTDLTLKPKRNEDGSVDYHELDIINQVEKGDLLAKLIPADVGTPGMDVYGKEVKPRATKNLKLDYGNNILVSEDRTELYSAVTGHVSLIKDTVFVSDIYNVPADVDNSTGNIHYPGNVHVRGNVKGGFMVAADGDIEIDGVVEDATVQAGGRIVVKRGIHGRGKGVLRAKGDILCHFIESATVMSGGSIETESILHSQVSAHENIVVSGKKGFITGGVIRAGNVIEAKTIGSVIGAVTRLEVGVAPEEKAHFIELQKRMQQNSKMMEQIRPVLLSYGEKMARGEYISPDRIQSIEQLTETMHAKEEEMRAIQMEYTKLQLTLLHNNNARVKVSRTICAGVVVGISDLCMTMKDDRSYCQIVKSEGEIKIIPL